MQKKLHNIKARLRHLNNPNISQKSLISSWYYRLFLYYCIPNPILSFCSFAKRAFVKCAVMNVSAISGPTIFCSVLKNFQAVSWAGCRHRSIKVTIPSKHICIRNKVNLSSVNWKFKRRSETTFNLSQWIKFKICLLQLKLLLKQIKTVQKLFHILP